MSVRTAADWWFEPLWKIWKSIGMIIPNISGKILKMATKPPTRLAATKFRDSCASRRLKLCQVAESAGCWNQWDQHCVEFCAGTWLTNSRLRLRDQQIQWRFFVLVMIQNRQFLKCTFRTAVRSGEVLLIGFDNVGPRWLEKHKIRTKCK